MASITSIDREACRHIRQLLDALMPQLEASTGLKIKVGSARFTPENVTFKLEMATVAKDGTVESKEARAFKLHAKSYHLDPEDFGKTFESRGHKYTICGLASRSYKFPILAKRNDGKVFKFPSNMVAMRLGKNLPHRAYPNPLSDNSGDWDGLDGSGIFEAMND